MSANILLIESSRANAPSFAIALHKKGYRVTVQHNVERAIKSVKSHPPELMILDAASMRTSGVRMCRKLSTKFPNIPLILVSPEGSRPNPTSGASITLIHPFTSRKLINRLVRLLPADERHSIKVGPIWLNLAQRKVRCAGKEARLTPKQSNLLELLMKSPGKVFSRKSIMRDIWQTDYLGDTRTLDVHMSWLRRAIEKDPAKPELLQTIRGVGYRLSLPEE